MSEKNFASYGDMETLVTELVDKCGPYTEIAYEDWLQLTPYQQEHGRWDVTGVPGADGTISIDLMTKLWENPDPTSSFSEQNVTLSSDEYDFLMIVFNINSVIINKGGDGNSLYTGIKSNIVYNWRRYFSNIDDTTVHFYTGNQYQPSNNTSSNNNTEIIPIAIYGIKLHHTVEIKAIAPEVSTLASKCMLSDGDTSVEDMFFAPDYANAVAVTPNTTYTVPNDGYFIAARLYGSAAGSWIKINGLSIMQCNPGSARDMGSCVYSVKKGDTVITSNLDASVARLFFATYRR